MMVEIFDNNWFYTPGFLILFVILMIWSVVWKGLALWKAARQGSKPWFIVLLIVNTLGILEIIYLFIFADHSEVKRKK